LAIREAMCGSMPDSPRVRSCRALAVPPSAAFTARRISEPATIEALILAKSVHGASMLTNWNLPVAHCMVRSTRDCGW
jgi:hypothetical protein